MNLKVAPASVEVKMIPPRLSNTGMSAVSITWEFKAASMTMMMLVMMMTTTTMMMMTPQTPKVPPYRVAGSNADSELLPYESVVDPLRNVMEGFSRIRTGEKDRGTPLIPHSP